MSAITLLWVDDEIDILRPHIMFLEKKGYAVAIASNGQDAIDLCRSTVFDLVLLDENMPGLTGLEVLPFVKELQPETPVVMVTKNEAEDIMEDAIGSKIADYLIKPVNPYQILHSLKKNIHQKEIVSDKTTFNYQQAFHRIASQIQGCESMDDWKDLYRLLVHWELELASQSSALLPLLQQQKEEANRTFCRFVKHNYERWMAAGGADDRPLMSPDLFKQKIFPMLDNGEKLFVVLIDNLRFDQWRSIKPLIAEHFIVEEDIYTSILPTATQYARNAVFSGLMPLQIEKMFPAMWVDEDSEEGKNLNEEPMIRSCLERFRKPYSLTYTKVFDNSYMERVIGQFSRFFHHPLNVVVLNFIDMLSHARTESHIVRQLAETEASYRSLTEAWVRHTAVGEFFWLIAQKGFRVVLTTDHGSIRVANPEKVIGSKGINSNLRYKVGRGISFNEKSVFEISQPERVGLPSPSMSSSYIFAQNQDFFAYPNNYTHYVGHYRDTFQHGGVSMEEMLIPLITLTPKR